MLKIMNPVISATNKRITLDFFSRKVLDNVVANTMEALIMKKGRKIEMIADDLRRREEEVHRRESSVERRESEVAKLLEDVVAFEAQLREKARQLEQREAKIGAEKIGIDDMISNFRDAYTKIIALKEETE